MGSCRRELAGGHPLLGFCFTYALTLEGLCLPEELGGAEGGNRGLTVGVACGGLTFLSPALGDSEGG